MGREAVKSGIPGMDGMIGGGFSKGSVIALSGPTGCGKSSLAMQFLVGGAQESGESGLYIALEETRTTAFANFSGFNWNLGRLERDKQLLFLDYPISEVDQFLVKNSAVEELISTTGIQRVVVDSVMPISLLFHGDDERQSGLLKLVDNIRKWGTTTIIVSEDTEGTPPDVLPHTKSGIESLTDGWMHVYYLYDGLAAGRTRSLEILKMKGVPHTNKIVPLTINDDGVSVGNKNGGKPPVKSSKPPRL